MASYPGMAHGPPSQEHEMDILPNAQHILDQRRRDALAEIDNAPFSRKHARICLVAGVGFFTDAYVDAPGSQFVDLIRIDSYDIFAINIASTMLGYVYGDRNSLMLSRNQDLLLKIAAPVGIVIGQLFFGWLADVVGRKRMYGVELTIMIVATFGQAVSAHGDALDIIGILFVWRFIMGIGIGGDYPLSAVMTSEFSATKFRGRMMAAVVSAQGFGNFTAALVGLIVVSAYKHEFPSLRSGECQGDLKSIDSVWRLLIGLGCVPAAIGLGLRLTIPETPRFTMDIARNIVRATRDINSVVGGENDMATEDAFIRLIDAPIASWADFRVYFGQRRNFLILLGTSWSWFALDIAFYGLGLNSNIIFGAILPIIEPGVAASTDIADAHRRLSNLCIGNLILSAAGLIPGYFFSFFLIDIWGRKKIQFMGFTTLSVLLIALGFTYDTLLTGSRTQRRGYFALYVFANFFQNFGANVTTFVIPGEVFPTRYRSTAYGISAACGKVGAIVAQLVFSLLQHNGALNNTSGGAMNSTTTANNTMAANSTASTNNSMAVIPICIVQLDGTITNSTIANVTGNSITSVPTNIDVPLIIFAFVTFTGIASTLLLPETMGLTLEQLSNEAQEGFVRGVTSSRL